VIQGLVHDPYGVGDPYHPGPTERSPHTPQAGEPVVLGVATWPVGAAQRVWGTWQVNGHVKGQVEARHTLDEGNCSYWQVELPGFQQGDCVEYQLHAAGGRQELKTQAFCFQVVGWCTIGDVQRIENKGQALLITGRGLRPEHPPQVHLSFPRPDTLRVRLAPMGHLDVHEAKNAPLCHVMEGADDHITVTTDRLILRIDCFPYRLSVFDAGGKPILAEAEPGVAWLTSSADDVWAVADTFTSPPEEAFFGFGERFNAFNQRGNTLDILVYDQYKKQGKRTYFPLPFFISSQGYGLYLDTSRYATYDLAASTTDRWSFSVHTESGRNAALDYYLFVGTPKEILGAFTALLGRPALPPQWAFGPWMSSNEWNNQATVLEQVRQTRLHDIPATVLVIEAWSDESTFYIWNDARYTPQPSDQPFRYSDFTFPPDGQWPDPKGLVEFLHAQGMHVLLWQVPVMKKLDAPHPQHDLDEAYMIEHGYCVRQVSGAPYRIRPFWFRGGLVLDFTDPDAERWWLSKRAYLLDEVGIDGFKTDGGEHLWGHDLAFADGCTGIEAANVYPALYTGAYHRFARDKRGEAITFSRAGFTGSGSCHWAGDEDSTWEAFRASILAGLNAGASGIPFWGWDLAGFSGEIPSAELYLRATAMACFCPIMQYHSEFNEHRQPSRDRTPWNIQARTGDQDVIPIFRQYAKLRMELLPYIYEQARKASHTGVPLMRALPIEYPDDRQVYDFPYQYLFGDALLVAPVVWAGTTHQAVYLPEGEWADCWTGLSYHGPVILDYATPKHIIPVLTRSDAMRFF